MIPQFNITPLEPQSKGAMKRLRHAGLTPVSIQHKGMKTLHFQQATQPLADYIQRYGASSLIDVVNEQDGQKRRVLIQEVQRDCLTGKLLVVIYQLIQQDDLLKTYVPVAFIGEPQEEHLEDAYLHLHLDRLQIECRQNELPSNIVIHVGHLTPGASLRVSDLPADARYRVLNAPNTVVISLDHQRSHAAHLAQQQAEAV